MNVLKFGGSSVANSNAIKQVLEIIGHASKKQQIAVVVSAFGNTTDQLVKAANLASDQNEKYKEVLQIAKKAHDILGCRGVTRSDFRFYKNNFYLLETNTQPGMTKLSLVPEIARYCGIKFEDLIAWIVKDASKKR